MRLFDQDVRVHKIENPQYKPMQVLILLFIFQVNRKIGKAVY